MHSKSLSAVSGPHNYTDADHFSSKINPCINIKQSKNAEASNTNFRKSSPFNIVFMKLFFLHFSKKKIKIYIYICI